MTPKQIYEMNLNMQHHFISKEYFFKIPCIWLFFSPCVISKLGLRICEFKETRCEENGDEQNHGELCATSQLLASGFYTAAPTH